MQAHNENAAPGLKDALLRLKEEALSTLKSVNKKEELTLLKAKFLGKKGELKQVLSSLGRLPEDERVLVGKVANEVKDALSALFDEKERALELKDQSEKLKVSIDTSIPGRMHAFGSVHPLTSAAEVIVGVLERLGFMRATGPEIEHDFYNFEALNIPKTHPARDMQDTFYIAEDVVLRTHTSPVQIRTMEKMKPPVRIICPGKVFRRDAFDPTHSPMFHQVEGLLVDEGVTFADMKGTLERFHKQFFGETTRTRLRPSFFPF